MRKQILFGILSAMSDALVGSVAVAPYPAQVMYDITSTNRQRQQPRTVHHAPDLLALLEELQHGRI